MAERISSKPVGASGGARSKSIAPAGVEKISDMVYLLHAPKGGKVEIEIVFVHGLQLSAYGHAYWETWTTVDEKGESNCWPVTWLVEEMPQARILSLSYDSSALKTRTQGRMDSYIVGESLLAEMVNFGAIGQSGCPLLFVCHSLGGIVVKEFRGFNKLVVSEASARHEYDDHFLPVNADHFSVCKPTSKIDSTFKWLTHFIRSLQTSEFNITTSQEQREAVDLC